MSLILLIDVKRVTLFLHTNSTTNFENDLEA